MSEAFDFNHPSRELVMRGDAIPNPTDFPDLFTDPIVVDVTLPERLERRHGVPHGYVFHCTCYPNTPTAEFSTVAPDGTVLQTWVKAPDENLDYMMLGLACELDRELRHEHRRAEVFPVETRLSESRIPPRRHAPEGTRMDITLTATEPAD